jgi:very-short-patch-repair endonuclease
MSLARNSKLILVARTLCRDLRKKMTPCEQLFWNQVRGRKYHGKKFYRQHPIFFDHLGKETFFIADFYCHEERLVVEIDGKIHDYRRNHDRLRSRIINELGIRVVRFRNDEIDDDIGGVMVRLSKEMKG